MVSKSHYLKKASLLTIQFKMKSPKNIIAFCIQGNMIGTHSCAWITGKLKNKIK